MSRLATHSFTRLVDITFGTIEIKAASVTVVRNAQILTGASDGRGNRIHSEDEDKSVSGTLTIPAAEKETIAALEAVLQTMDTAGAVATPPVPFAGTDASTSPPSSVTCPQIRLMGHPTEGWTRERDGNRVLTYPIDGAPGFIVNGGYI